ncbi:TetR/AcrR family transcriptional regulator [Mycolicibacterium farcinogenes]|uniref:TetR/AcrR family transcriptional regulator n=1 Tax=Mycolicibacterium farcinogenes TaxID=1802 RepID=UPI0021ADEBA1|nr:TetR/AcrR family transcriptional regulator [Mycolicibacterium farcinogenes]
MLKNEPTPGRKGERTRERLLGAAISEFRRTGVAGADVKAISASAGVTPGTFYFYFPSKEHVLIELERREEERIATDLARFFARSPTLPESLSKIVDTIQSLEYRLGSRLFKDFLALHFSSARRPEEVWTNHPVIVVVVEQLQAASERKLLPPQVDPLYSGLFFLVGLYALLLTLPSEEAMRREVLARYLETSLRGMGCTEDAAQSQ